MEMPYASILGPKWPPNCAAANIRTVSHPPPSIHSVLKYFAQQHSDHTPQRPQPNPPTDCSLHLPSPLHCIALPSVLNYPD